MVPWNDSKDSKAWLGDALLAANVAAVQARIVAAAHRAERDPREVCLIAVTKRIQSHGCSTWWQRG